MVEDGTNGTAGHNVWIQDCLLRPQHQQKCNHRKQFIVSVSHSQGVLRFDFAVLMITKWRFGCQAALVSVDKVDLVNKVDKADKGHKADIIAAVYNT